MTKIQTNRRMLKAKKAIHKTKRRKDTNNCPSKKMSAGTTKKNMSWEKTVKNKPGNFPTGGFQIKNIFFSDKMVKSFFVTFWNLIEKRLYL